MEKEDECNGCGKFSRFLDKNGVCIRCNKSYGGKVVKETIGTYKKTIEVKSKTGNIEENRWMK